MAKRPARTEALTIRLDPKTRFMLEFVARLRGQTITTVVERAIAAAADAAAVKKIDRRTGNEYEDTWRDYWDVIDGVRALKLATESTLHPTYDEERRLAFAKKHWPFFYTSSSCEHLRSGYIEILWPRIDEFIQIGEEQKASDFFAAGKAMKQAISDAGVVAPDWPVKAEGGFRRPSANAPAFEPGGMDDDIPF